MAMTVAEVGRFNKACKDYAMCKISNEQFEEIQLEYIKNRSAREAAESGRTESRKKFEYAFDNPEIYTGSAPKQVELYYDLRGNIFWDFNAFKKKMKEDYDMTFFPERKAFIDKYGQKYSLFLFKDPKNLSRIKSVKNKTKLLLLLGK